MGETAGLWLAVIGSGVYHGANPGMGWPLAVSAAMMEGGRRPLARALGALAVGHLAAMLAVLLPFAALALLAEWQREIRLAGGALVAAAGLWLLANPRHPRILARIPPGRLALWSFLVATAHGAGLMLVPVYLGLCGPDMPMPTTAGLSIAVALVHTAAMLMAGGAAAVAVHAWLGIGVLRLGWFDLDRVWAASLVLVGTLGIAAAL